MSAEPQKSSDPYPVMTEAQKSWLMATIEGMVKNPGPANLERIKGGLDLEIAIHVLPEDEAVFTEEVCLALGTLLRSATGVIGPVVYLHGKPHAKAREVVLSARHDV